MRKEYWTIQIFYDKKPKSGHYLELEYNKKQDALRELSEYRSLGFKTKLNTCTDLPLFFHDPRDEQIEEKQIIIIPNKRGRKAKYL